MKRLLIVWTSTSGAAAQLARAVWDGARVEPQVQAVLLRAPEASVDDVLQAHAYVFVTPEYLASMAGLMKDFFDRTYYGVLDQINGRRYAAVVSAGSDGSGAARQIARICTGLRLTAIADCCIVNTQAQTAEQILAPKHISDEKRQLMRELGHTMAAGLAAGIY